MAFKEFYITRRMIVTWGVIPAVIIFLGVGAYYNYKGTVEMNDYHFDGMVDSVSYDIKGKASIIVKGSHFYLGDPDWDFDHNRIQKGDSLIKKRNSMIIKLIKHSGQIIVEGIKPNSK